MKGLKIVLGLSLLTCLFGCGKKTLRVDLKDKGLCVSIGYERYTFDSNTNKWKPYHKYEIIYDENGKKLYDLIYIWYKKDKWTHLEDKDEYIYDDNGLLIKKISSYDFSHGVINEGNRTIEYEYEGNVLKTTTERTKTLGLLNKETYSYDSNGNISCIITEKTGSNPSFKREFIYNENNLKTKTLYYEYDSSSATYKDPIDEDIYEYDENNNLITYYHNNTEKVINEVYWTSGYKEVSTYDSNNKKIETIGYTINGENVQMAAKFAYDYFNNGNTKSVTVSRYMNNEWVISYKNVYLQTTYNN